MIMINNWKYNEWLKLGYQYHAPEDYISMEVYPEDIEIFSKILLLDTIEHKGRVIKINPSSTEEETKKDFDKQIVFSSTFFHFFSYKRKNQQRNIYEHN